MKLAYVAAVCGLSIVMAGPALAQQKGASPAGGTAIGSAPQTSDQAWEYVVVSYGKTLFGAPQKTLAYRTVGLPDGQEGSDLQRSLDILGRFGWELVSVVGAIGGDQQLILKRRFDRVRSNSESAAILRGKELYVKDLIDILEREQRVREETERAAEAERNRPRLIELDAAEALAARKRRAADLEAGYADALKKAEIGKYATLSAGPRSSYAGDFIVNVAIDLTFMSDAGTYRKSVVMAYLKEQMDRFRYTVQPQPLDKYGSILIRGTGFINFQGQRVDVATYKAEFNTISSRWSDN